MNIKPDNITLFLNIINNHKMEILKSMSELFNSVDVVRSADVISQITKHIFLSDFRASIVKEELEKNKIDVILYLGTVEKSVQYKNIYTKLDIKEIHIDYDCDDNKETPIGKHFSRTYDIINQVIEQDGNILIHCVRGTSIAPTIVIAYYLKQYYSLIKEPPSESQLYDITCMVFKKRKSIEPNEGFIKQLIEYEKFLFHSRFKPA